MSSPQVPDMLLTQEDQSQSPPLPLTAGQLLKKARLAKGVHLAVLAMNLKVPVRLLEALEADDYRAFKGGPTFLRATTASMCRHLGMDAAPVLALLPSAVSVMQTVRPPIEPLTGLQRISQRRSKGVNRSARSVLVLAALMISGTAAFLWLPAPQVWWSQFFASDPSAPVVEEAAVPLGQASNPQSSVEVMPQLPAGQASAPSPAPMSSPPLPAAKPGALFAPMSAPVADGSTSGPRLDALESGRTDRPDARGSVAAQQGQASAMQDASQTVAQSEVKE